MRPVAVVPVEPSFDVSMGISEVVDAMLPDALLLEASEEALDEAIQLRRVERDEFLPKSVVAARSSIGLEGSHHHAQGQPDPHGPHDRAAHRSPHDPSSPPRTTRAQP